MQSFDAWSLLKVAIKGTNLSIFRFLDMFAVAEPPDVRLVLSEAIHNVGKFTKLS